MSYSKQTWQTGDTITAAKLNHMEDGIDGAGGGGSFVVTFSEGESWEADKTFAEVEAAINAGMYVVSYCDGGYMPLLGHVPSTLIAFGYTSIATNSITGNNFVQTIHRIMNSDGTVTENVLIYGDT